MQKLISVVALIAAVLLMASCSSNEDGSEPAATDQSSSEEEMVILAPAIPRGQRGDGFGYALNNEGYEFSADWFSEKTPAWEAALAPFKAKPGVQYLEVGVYEGMSVAWMLENILTDPSSRVTAVDIFYGTVTESVNGFSEALRDKFLRNVEAAGGTDKIRVITEFSQTALRRLPAQYFDIIYIDGSHMAPDVLEDAVLAMRLLKKDGVLIFDDYRWKMKDPLMNRPKYALDVFVEFYGEQFDYLHNGSQLILRRKELDFVGQGMGGNQSDTGMPSAGELN
jgi:predicted O-methyltransferase YrrM